MRTSPGPPDPRRSGSQPELSLAHEIEHWPYEEFLPMDTAGFIGRAMKRDGRVPRKFLITIFLCIWP